MNNFFVIKSVSLRREHTVFLSLPPTTVTTNFKAIFLHVYQSFITYQDASKLVCIFIIHILSVKFLQMNEGNFERIHPEQRPRMDLDKKFLLNKT